MSQNPYDIIVAGGGNAALCAAITARRAGARVLVAEHAPQDFRAGNSRHTRNLRVAHAQPDSFLSGSYDEAEYWDDLLRVTGGETDESLARLTIRATEELPEWMGACGVRFQPPLTGTLNLSRTNLFFFGGGKALMNSYYACARKLGVDIAYDTEVTDIRLDGDHVASVRLRQGDDEHELAPRAVVAASGGFQANLDWLGQYWGEAAENFLVRGTPYAQGGILRNLLDQGVGSAGDPTQFHAVAIDARAPKFDGGIVTRLDCVPFSIVVNRDAERFYDEGEDVWPKRYAIWGRMVAQQPGQIAYVIFDAKVREKFMPSVYPAVEADSLEMLAAKLGLDAHKLVETVTRYNAAVEPGEIDGTILDGRGTAGLTPPKTNWAQRIDQPPFQAYPLRPGITFTYLGVRVNERAQVLTDGSRPIRNLFAAGEIMAGNILGRGYLAGFGMSIGTVFGRLAGKGAVQSCA